MTFEKFVAEWTEHMAEFGGSVESDALDMAREAWRAAWNEATKAEREACAKVCEEQHGAWNIDGADAVVGECAKAIRARGGVK